MKIKNVFGLALILGAGVMSEGAYAKTEITVYNQNLALIKKQQMQNLNQGINEIVFDEVARKMQPESAFIYGDNIDVWEQNYDFSGISYLNLLEANIGKKVKTIRENPADGKHIFEKALLVAVQNGQPILKFDYGIEAKFGGRVLFEDIAQGLTDTPILKAKIKVDETGEKKVNLAYLTTGFSWNADYVAQITDDKSIALLGRVSLKNNSGSDFDNVKVNLVAGEVNQVRNYMQPRVSATRMAQSDGIYMMAAPAAKIAKPTTLNGYYVYNLPQETDLKDGQIKQVSFVDAKKVNYLKENLIKSDLNFGIQKSFYKNVHPKIKYTFVNEDKNGLGLPLPKGQISFYENDKNNELQFVGEDLIRNTAKGEKIEVNLGESFDIYSNGKVTNLQKINERKYKKNPSDRCVTAEHSYLYDVVYSVTNKGKYKETVLLKQPFPTTAQIITESEKSVNGDGNEKIWKIMLDPEETKDITVTINNKMELKVCD